MPRPPLPDTPVICGPTAGGKSDLAVELALLLAAHHHLPAHVLTADAFQVYQGLNIGTAKPTPAERKGVEHHLVDLVAPGDAAPFTLDRWLELAHSTIDALRARGVLPIVVGGTHLYVKALLEGLFDGPKADPALRAELSALDPATLRARLEAADPAAAARIHPADLRRTIRALEVFHLTGTPISALQTQWDRPAAPTGFRLIVLDWHVDAINRRINARVKRMLDQGLLDEVRALVEARAFTPQSAQALGYKQLIPVVSQALSAGRWPPPQAQVDDAVEQIKIQTRRFAKNQRTWLKRLALTQGTIRLDPSIIPQDQWPTRVADALLTPAPEDTSQNR
jgi:tRNA dimethylallyltransferase